MTQRLRYRVELHEGSKAFLIATFESVTSARRWAMTQWDDALPANSVHVIDTHKGREVGRVRHRGDGEPVWVPKLTPAQREEMEQETIG